MDMRVWTMPLKEEAAAYWPGGVAQVPAATADVMPLRDPRLRCRCRCGGLRHGRRSRSRRRSCRCAAAGYKEQQRCTQECTQPSPSDGHCDGSVTGRQMTDCPFVGNLMRLEPGIATGF